jgi:hypothetical protein
VLIIRKIGDVMGINFWNSDEWTAFGTVLLGAGAVIGGLWAIFNYMKNRRNNAANWLNTLFSEFYIEGKFDSAKELLEYNYMDICDLIERRLTNRDIEITKNYVAILRSIDMFLNFLEYILYLENEKHITLNDRQMLFEYWFSL